MNKAGGEPAEKIRGVLCDQHQRTVAIGKTSGWLKTARCGYVGCAEQTRISRKTEYHADLNTLLEAK